MTTWQKCGMPQQGMSCSLYKGHTGSVACVAFSPDGKRIVTGSEDSTAKVWDATTGDQAVTLRGGGSAVAFSPDGSHFASGCNSYEFMRARIMNFDGVEGFMTRKMRSANNRLQDYTAQMWEVPTGKKTLTFQGLKDITSVAFAPDGKRIVAGGMHNRAMVWDTTTGRLLLTLRGGTRYVKKNIFHLCCVLS